MAIPPIPGARCWGHITRSHLFCFGLGKNDTNIWIRVFLDETDEVGYCICIWEPLNKSSAAVSRSFSSTLRYRKREILRSRCQRKLAYGCGIPLAGTYSIPPFSIPRLAEKSLAHSSCRFNQSFLRIIIEATPLLIMKCADK